MVGYQGRGLHGQAVQTLGQRVVAGDWAPGDTIYPDQLETEMGVSKTVVREALRVLGAKGLVDSRPKRGTFVRERAEWNLLDRDVIRWQLQGKPTKEVVANLAELRVIVEPACARLAALRRDDDDVAALRDALDAMAGAGRDADAAVRADLDFHRCLLAATHNEILTQLDVTIISALDVRDREVHRPGGRWRDPTPAHRAVADAVEARDPERSAAAMLELLARARADVRAVRRRRSR